MGLGADKDGSKDRPQYSFMLRKRRDLRQFKTERGDEAIAYNLAIFRANLKLPDVNSNSRSAQKGEEDRAIFDFVRYVHEQAHWYNRKVLSEYRWQQIYLVFSIFLLVAIPIVIAW